MVLFLLAQPVMMPSWLTCGQKQTTHKRGTVTVWSLQARAAGSVPPRSRGTADCLRLPFPARSRGQTVVLFSSLIRSPLATPWSFLKYISKGFCFSECFCLQARSNVPLPCLRTYSADKADKSQLRAACSCTETYGAKLSHAELSVQNTL